MQGSHSSHSSLARTHTSSSSLPSDPSTPRDLLHDRLVPARPSPPQAAPLPLACLSVALIAYVNAPNQQTSDGVTALIQPLQGDGRLYWARFAKGVSTARTALVANDAGELPFRDMDIDATVPLFAQVVRERNIGLFDNPDNILHLFTKDGKPRSRAPSAPAGERGGGSASSAARSHASSFGAGQGGPSLNAQLDELLDKGEDDQPQPRSKGKDTGRPAGTSRKANRPRAADFDSGAGAGGDNSGDPSDGGGDSSDEDEDYGQRRPADSDEDEPDLKVDKGISNDVLAQAAANLSTSNAVQLDRVPDVALKTYELAQAYRDSKFKSVVKTRAQNEAAAMPVAAAEAIIKGLPVDYGQIYAHKPGHRSVAHVGGDLFVDKPPPSTKIPDILSWLFVFDKVTRLTVEMYRHRRKELERYREWFMGSCYARPDLFAQYRDYDDDYRRNFGTFGYGWTLDDARVDSAAQMRATAIPSRRAPRRADALTGTTTQTTFARGSTKAKTTTASTATGASRAVVISVLLAAALAMGGSTRPALSAQEAPEEETLIQSLLSRSGSEEEDTIREGYRLAGTSSTPRLRRGLFFASSSPSTPAVDRTADPTLEPPLPSIPASVLSDPVTSSTLAQAPHLFNVSSPIDQDRLRMWLAPHPNRPLVESILLGFEQGFWPGHSGEFDLSDSPPHDIEDDDHDLLNTQLAKDYDKGYLSESFTTLLPGMVVSPMFVVRLDKRKPRAVVDMSASGLNNGVSREVARTYYDTISELGRLMRHRRLRGEDSRGVLWKSDVSGAFRTIPVAPQWQLKQVHRSRVWDARKNRYRFVYYVDHRLVFGGRFSPKLWCTVINTIHWCIRHRLGLEFPLLFVDDTFGYDVSGKTVTVQHPETGESRAVPLEQGTVLVAWKTLGVPWEWDKQESGSSLIILGHLVDGPSLTVTLPAQARADFVAFVQAFIAQGEPPLRDWWRLTGYAQWASTTNPWIRFTLRSLYDKTAGKTRPRGLVPLNDQNRRDLRRLIDELENSPPLYLLDPALEPWSGREADIIAYTDACLHGANGSTGLGAWWKSSPDGPRLAFSSRLPLPLDGIALAEARAVHDAIMLVLERNPDLRRLLVRSDSASSVYAFDSGSAKDDIQPLVSSAYDALRQRKVDLRIEHIPGDRNVTADKLNPLRIAIAGEGSAMSRYAPRGRRVRISKRSQFPSSRSAHQPNPSLAALEAEADSFIQHSREASTRRSYTQDLKNHWFPFLRIYKFSPRPTAYKLKLFVVWCSHRIRGVQKVLSALRWHHRFSDEEWASIRSHPDVRDALRGFAKRNPHTPKRAPPLLPEHLRAFVAHALRPGASYDDLLAAAMATVGFCGLMRLGTMVRANRTAERDPRKYIRRDSVAFQSETAFSFFLPYDKQDYLWQGATISIISQNGIVDFDCVKLFRLYLKRRDSLFPTHPYLFTRHDALPPPRSFFSSRLRLLAPGCTGHSLRAGGATFLASLGVHSDVIKRCGRWSSKAWEIYIRSDPAIAASILRVDFARLA
ncbi:hypothetical protein OF846_001494 [Rhodotorula toruloides]|nr:hypothetical protein OF846_003789 [Rhodotorula toruloides]KAJ8295242.1 hypothetical protein OF846_001494 [Rhodotorula toruloides]